MRLEAGRCCARCTVHTYPAPDRVHGRPAECRWLVQFAADSSNRQQLIDGPHIMMNTYDEKSKRTQKQSVPHKESVDFGFIMSHDPKPLPVHGSNPAVTVAGREKEVELFIRNI